MIKEGESQIRNGGDKSIWKSKTMQGIIVAWLGYKLKSLGIDLPQEILDGLTDLLVQGGVLLAAIGRIVASQKLK